MPSRTMAVFAAALVSAASFASGVVAADPYSESHDR